MIIVILFSIVIGLFLAMCWLSFRSGQHEETIKWLERRIKRLETK